MNVKCIPRSESSHEDSRRCATCSSRTLRCTSSTPLSCFNPLIHGLHHRRSTYRSTAASAGYPRSLRVNRTRYRTWHIIRRDLAGCRVHLWRRLPSRGALGSYALGTLGRGTKWPRVGECPVPFVFATCLKTSPCTRLLLFPCACVFTKRKRARAMDAVEIERERERERGEGRQIFW